MLRRNVERVLTLLGGTALGIIGYNQYQKSKQTSVAFPLPTETPITPKLRKVTEDILAYGHPGMIFLKLYYNTIQTEASCLCPLMDKQGPLMTQSSEADM